MTRKTPPRSSTWQKSTTVELSDGWNLVTSSKARSIQSSIRSTSQPRSVKRSEERLADLKDEIEKYLGLWKASQCYADFATSIRKWKVDVQADSIICLGLGSLCTDLNHHKRRSLWQLAVFLSIPELVAPRDQAQADGNVMLYAQEPRFTSTDREILQLYHVQILDGNNAREYITRRTIIYAPFLQWTIMLKDILSNQDPAICISINIREALNQIELKIQNGLTDLALEGDRVDLKGCASVGRSFLRGRDDAEFPKFEHDANALFGLRIYSRTVDVDG